MLLDAGIVAELQSADMQNFRAVFTAVVQGQVRPLSWGCGAEAGEGRQLKSLMTEVIVFSLLPLTILPKRGDKTC